MLELLNYEKKNFMKFKRLHLKIYACLLLGLPVKIVKIFFILILKSKYSYRG